MAALIELKDLTCFSSDQPGFIEGANATFIGGEKVAILIPLDSVKRLIIQLIAGFVTPDKGEVYVFGKNLEFLDEESLNSVRQKIGFVFPDCMLISNLKVIENVSLPLLYHSDLSYDESMQRALRLLGIAGYRGEVWAPPGTLSTHALRAVATARAMAMEPDILICEDISGGLSVANRERLMGVTTEYHSSRTDSLLLHIIYNESDIALIDPDRVLRMDGNRLVE